MNSSEVARSGRWRILLLLMALCFVSHLNRLAMPVAGTERIIPGGYGITPEEMGRVYTSYLAVYTLGMILGGWGIDRRGPRMMLMIMGLGSALFGALTGGLGFGLVGSAHLLAGLLVVRGVMGLFTTPLHPASARAVSSWFPANQHSSANGIVTFAAVLGMASATPVFGALIDRFGWPTAFLIAAGALLFVTALWVVFGKDRPTAEQARPSLSAEFPSLITPSLVLLTLSYAAVGYFQYLFFYWSEYYFKDVLHLSTGQSRMNSTTLILALGVGMPVGGYLADRAQCRFSGRLGWGLVPGIGMACSAAFLFLGVFAGETFWIVGFFAFAMFALGASESSFWQAAVQLGGRRGGMAAAILNTGGNGIGLLAPMLTPVISAALGWRWGICLGGIVGLLGALCWLGINPFEEEGRRSASSLE